MYIKNLHLKFECIFLNKKTCQFFEKSATSSDITPIIDCAESSFTVKLIEDLDGSLLEKPGDYYDKLMDMDRTLAEQERSAQGIHATDINMQPKDGRYVYIRYQPSY